MSDTTQLIKDKLDIVEFLKQYIELKPAGKNFKALCPFHKEKTPSFMISPERQTWHCFGSCGEGGDIIKFLMKYENLEFYDVLKILAEKAGVEIRSSENRDFKSSNVLYKAMEAAKDFFKSNLKTSQVINNYLKERGLKNETIEEFELGLAPDGSDILTRHLLKQGYNILDIEKAGLTIKTERGTYWDRFRSRVMFPIYNHMGKVVAFTGRILPGNENQPVGKYVNSPETSIFQKSKILYGFYKTKNDIRELKTAVLVEGQMDFLMMWQDDVKNVVATSGTALTNDHLIVLRRLADELILSFDADEAGQIAAERSIDLANAHDFSVKILVFDENENEKNKPKDPADIVKQKPGLIKELIKKAKPAMEYYFHKYLKGSFGDIKAKKKNLRIILSKIKNLSSSIERNHWLKELAVLSKIDEKILAEEMEMLSNAVLPVSREAQESSQEPDLKLSRLEFLSQRLLGIILHLKSDFKIPEEYLKYIPQKYFQIYERFSNKNSGKKAEKSDLDEIVDIISLRFSFENQRFDADNLKKEEEKLLHELKVEYLKEKQREIGKLIDRFEKEGDEAKLEDALCQHNEISKEMQGMQNL